MWNNLIDFSQNINIKTDEHKKILTFFNSIKNRLLAYAKEIYNKKLIKFLALMKID